MANTKIPSELIDGTLGVAGITSSADSGRTGHIGLRRKVPWTLRDRPGAWGSGDWSVGPPWGHCTKSRRPRVYKFCSLWPPSCSCPLGMSLDTLSKATLSTAPSPCHMARLWGSPSWLGVTSAVLDDHILSF